MLLVRRNSIKNRKLLYRNEKLYIKHLKTKLLKSNEDIKNGRILTLAESKERMMQKYESYTN